MSWVEEIAKHNGMAAPDAVAGGPVAAPDTVTPLPAQPVKIEFKDSDFVHGMTDHKILLPPPEPRRVCFGRRQEVNNPGISFTSLEALCGKPTRQAVGDQVTFEAELVTCPKCQSMLQGEAILKQAEAHHEGASVPHRAEAPPADSGQGWVEPGAFPLPQMGVKAFLDSLLDIPALTQKLIDLEGEAEAVRVLLRAAQARDAKRQELLDLGAAG